MVSPRGMDAVTFLADVSSLLVQQRLVVTDKTIARDELEGYLKYPAPPGPGEESCPC